MEKIRRIVRQKEFHVLVFCLCLVLFSYPLLAMSEEKPMTIMLSFFLSWALIIIVLFVMGLSYTEDAPYKKRKDPGSGKNV